MDYHSLTKDRLDRVWHCSLAIRAGEGILTDTQWDSIVRDFLQRMGMTCF